jgi:hypothetical protein
MANGRSKLSVSQGLLQPNVGAILPAGVEVNKRLRFIFNVMIFFFQMIEPFFLPIMLRMSPYSFWC